MATSTVTVFDDNEGIHVVGGADGIGLGNPDVVMSLMADHAAAHDCPGPGPALNSNELLYRPCREQTTTDGAVTYVKARLGDPGTIPMMSWAL